MNFKKHIKSCCLSILIIVIIFTIPCCNGHKKKVEKIDYLKADIKINSIEFVSNKLLSITSAAYFDDNIFVVSQSNIWKINLKDKKEEQIIKNGIGPNEIYKPKRLAIKENKCWVNSNNSLDKIFWFNPNEEKLKVNWFELPTNITLVDSLYPFSEKKLAVVYSDWKENLLRIIDKDKETIPGIGKNTFIEVMNKFNVNVADLKVNKGLAYVTQTIEPVIQVFSIEPLKQKENINLSPPFFIPVPEKYEVSINNREEHFKWMAKWTRVEEMFIDNDWMLIRYIRGYMVAFYYELFNLNDITKRYAIDETNEFIFSFKVIDGKFFIFSYEGAEEESRWKKGEIILQEK